MGQLGTRRFLAGALAAALVLGVASTAPRARAANAISLVQEIGSATHASSPAASSLSITVPAAGVPVGDTIIVLAGNSGSSVYASKVTDSRGNTYKVDVHKSSSAAPVNTTILSTSVTKPLLGGDTIKVTFNAATTILNALATDWRGIVAGTARLDAKATRQGNSTALSTNATPVTTQPNELVIGSFAAATSGTFTAGSGYAPFATELKSQLGSTYGDQWQEYRLASQAGAYTATATSSLTTQYAGAVATYRSADATPPSPPTAMTLTGASTASISASWTAATDDTGVAGYHLYVNGAPAGTTTSTSTTFGGLTCSTVYNLAVDAYDAAGNTSSAAALTAATLPCDTSAPTQPAGLAVGNVTASGATLSWSPSSDDVGVAGYTLYTNGAAGRTTTATTADFTGLVCNTTYTLGVDAYDAAGNHSAESDAQVTTGACDVTPPAVSVTAPAAGATVSGSTVVSADASDDRGVVGVQFKLDGNPLGAEDTAAPYSVTWSTTSVANGTHTLTATARDAAGNTAVSAPVAVTVQNLHSSVTPLPLISRGKPSFASSTPYPASNANDASYSTYWAPSALPAWLAYDLSSVPAAQRGRVLVAWYNDPVTSPYDYKVIQDVPYGLPNAYTIEANAAPGGGAAPASGWVTLLTITGNTYHSREHLVDLTGYNWIRLRITASLGGQPMFNLDVHDAGAAVDDSWLFLGDSITQDGLPHEPIYAPGPNFSQLINADKPQYFPAYEDGGIGGLTSNELAANINKWLALFPGHYVAMSYGTNDANACASTTTFYNNYVTAVQAVLAAGKVPVIPTIPGSKTANVKSCGPGINAKIQAIYDAYPQVVHGPDLWTFFNANPSLISSDNLHPNQAGYTALVRQWANAMEANVYP